MYLSREKGIFGKAVAIVGIIQGIGWVALCLTCIVLYNHPPDLPEDDDAVSTYNQYLSAALNIYFIQPSKNDTRIIRPKEFYAFMWIYLFASSIWVAASIDQYTAIRYNKKRQGHVTLILGILILLNSILDMIFVSLLARDLGQCVFKDTTSTTALADPTCNIATSIIMTIAARGYVMWLINIVLGIGMIVSAGEVLRSTMPKILSYDNHTIPRVNLGKAEPVVNPIERDNQFFRGGMNPALNPNSPFAPNNRGSTPAVLNGRNNTNMYF